MRGILLPFLALKLEEWSNVVASRTYKQILANSQQSPPISILQFQGSDLCQQSEKAKKGILLQNFQKEM
jgi:hypothetical protein